MRLVAPMTVALAVVLAACGSSSKPTSSPSGPTTTVHVAKLASNVPSASAKMICEKEASDEIYQSATGVKTIAPFKPTWIDHVYSCKYVYPAGAVMTLSVKEVSSPEETTTYFDSLAAKLGKKKEIQGLGQGAFQTTNGSMVVRKDYKIMLIDISKLPPNFGVPPAPRADVAVNVAATIMGCWTGA